MQADNAKPILRDAVESDMQAIYDIYADEVLHGVSSWEEQPPSVAELTSRFNNIVNNGFPYRVADYQGSAVGYAYASSYRPRSGYRYTVENTIYIHPEFRGLGLGRLLLEDLVSICEDKGYRQMIAVIGDSANQVSIDFHSRMGFSRTGVIKSIGFKHGRWMDSVIMQKPLGQSDQVLPT